MKIECEIVRDLFPNYIENQISNASKQIIEEHLKRCKECSKTLELINSNKEPNVDKENKEVDFLKKYNSKMKILKIIAIILSIIIIFAVTFKIGRIVYKYNNSKYIHSIISQVQEKTQDFKTQDNFIFSIKKPYSSNTYYYKSGKFKEEITYINSDGCNLKYGKIAGNDIITINYFDYVNIIESNIENRGYIFENKFEYLDNLVERNTLKCGEIKIREEQDCYILRENTENVDYILVIDKGTMLISRYEEIRADGYWNYLEYEYNTGNVTEDDVKIKNTEGYIIGEKTKKYLAEF